MQRGGAALAGGAGSGWCWMMLGSEGAGPSGLGRGRDGAVDGESARRGLAGLGWLRAAAGGVLACGALWAARVKGVGDAGAVRHERGARLVAGGRERWKAAAAVRVQAVCWVSCAPACSPCAWGHAVVRGVHVGLPGASAGVVGWRGAGCGRRVGCDAGVTAGCLHVANLTRALAASAVPFASSSSLSRVPCLAIHSLGLLLTRPLGLQYAHGLVFVPFVPCLGRSAALSGSGAVRGMQLACVGVRGNETIGAVDCTGVVVQ